MLKTCMTIFRMGLVFGLILTLLGSAKSQIDLGHERHDFMVNNSPLKTLELREAFAGQTHNGYYRFDREELPTHRFEETTAKDGGVTHTQAEEVLTGNWTLKDDQICFIYNEVWARQLCFDIYRVGNCYYHYLMTEGGRPVQAWTARSSLKGERPSCEPNIS